MSSITRELIRKRAEHNEGQVGSLEEVSLHQQDIVKIDHIQNLCRELKILLLQSNVISKIENLKKLKKLEYINLALNNIERIENLEGCESLLKLDLTLNFIGELTSIRTLKDNYNLRELYLTGNPCWKYDGYRDYVIAVLPQIEMLDGVNISPSDRITANQQFFEIEPKIQQQEEAYLKCRRLQKQSTSIQTKEKGHPDQEQSNEFWKQTCENSPETRLLMAEEIRKINKDRVVNLSEPQIPKRKVKLFKDNGCPLNVNEAKIPFTVKDEDECFVLIVDVYKHLDSSLLDVDVQPWFVRVVIKKKILQLTLDEEVQPDKSTAERMKGSGRLVVTMPKFQGDRRVIKPHNAAEKTEDVSK